ncbi:MAG: S1C family serine protease [Gammaproteobacteria bacterium]
MEKAVRIEVHWNGQEHEAVLRHADADRDLCSLSVPTLRAPAARLGSPGSLDIGSKVYAIGAPRGLSLTLSDGILSGKRGEILQITAPISPGSSGGGVFDQAGRLVGITTLYLRDSQQLNFAMPIDWVVALPQRHVPTKPQPSAAEKAALDALVEWDQRMRRVDPAYTARRPELDRKVGTIRQSLPPSQWIRATERAYADISERERATVAQVYRCLAGGVRQYSSTFLPESGCVVISPPMPSQPPQDDRRWFLLSREDGKTLEIDRETVERSGGIASAWIRQTTAAGTMTFMRFSFHCSTRRVRLTDSAVRASSGNVTAADEYPVRWQAVIPDSIGEGVYNYLCSAGG